MREKSPFFEISKDLFESGFGKKSLCLKGLLKNSAMLKGSPKMLLGFFSVCVFKKGDNCTILHSVI